ncbi:MAG TPA: tRNA uridine-5-carboxymethylaminomethyl(34) synthesis enzyme MnmG [Candidatus Margulisiibacteriota bacterium]|nr:tRNA uridine-5-carboxymethylaminomethyl(34) synthesis enzyme MnmG [Candidatus Margulisiibacteriota bacterium]
MNKYDVIVIGAGHAGIEAALAASRMGLNTILITLSLKTIGAMSCNPAIGGVGKGQLVKEIDALGGEMGSAADKCGIQFRMLNASKGCAVQSSRTQIDMYLYQDYMQGLLKRENNLALKEAEVKGIIVRDGCARGVVTQADEEIQGSCVVIAPGTFLDGLIHVGLKQVSGGRINEMASSYLAHNLKELGFTLLRFKTGTCPRLDKNSIDFSQLIVQQGDDPPKPFSFSTRNLKRKQVPCHITYTNINTHKIILDNLNRSPLYAGVIKGTGVRYCPSIEDKVVRFSDKERHQVFLEPQGIKSNEIYPNGLSTSLPEDVQLSFLRSIAGLEEAKVIRFGYGIEHTVVEPRQLYPTLEAKLVRNLFLAGQINGTTGYEEAAAQGLIAGINAGLRAKRKEALILDRSSSYIGVLIDDLTTKGTAEPYRMFTSRVEYRLILREDNADLRLRQIGYKIGLVSKKEHLLAEEKREAIKKGIEFLKNNRIKPGLEVNAKLAALNSPALKKNMSLEELLKRPQIRLNNLLSLNHFKLKMPSSTLAQIETEVKYSGFIQRQLKDVEKFRNLEKISLPPDIDYQEIPALSREIKEKLQTFRPLNLGQASRISGVTPAALSLLMIWLRKINAQR